MSKETNVVKFTCKELRITQKDLAKRIGVSENTMSEWSRGVTPVPKWATNYLNDLSVIEKYNIIKQLFLENDLK